MKPRFRVTYTLNGRTYEFCTPAPNAAHVWRTWDRPARLLSVIEVNHNNLPL